METTPNFRRTRTSRPKVKTGCLICKLRRLKCDELKPECGRCSATGRKCAYSYAVSFMTPVRNTATEILLLKAPAFYTGNPNEVRALEFFYRDTATQLSTYFDAQFWTRLIFQVSDGEDAIKHAMIALGSLAKQQGPKDGQVSRIRSVAVEEVLANPDPTRMNLPLIQANSSMGEGFALIHYNKAIAALSLRIDNSSVPIEVVLLACILFVCIEFLRGDIQPALKHFRAGMNIALQSLSDRSSITSTTLDRIRKNMLPFFSRVEFLSIVMGNDVDWEYAVPLEKAVPKSFTNMRQARESLVHLMNLSVRFIRDNRFRRYLGVDLTAEAARQGALHTQLGKWEGTFSSLILSDSIGASEMHAARVLRLHQIIASIWSGMALRPDESKADSWNLLFEQAVSIAHVIQASIGDLEHCGSPSFLFDVEIVSPLWFVVTKCRHPIIRRRAVDILRRTVRREGLWDSQLASAIAERLMAIEERSLQILDGSELPPEHDRVHASNIQLVPRMSSEAQVYVVTYYYKPDGLSRPWKTRYEEIELTRNRTS